MKTLARKSTFAYILLRVRLLLLPITLLGSRASSSRFLGILGVVLVSRLESFGGSLGDGFVLLAVGERWSSWQPGSHIICCEIVSLVSEGDVVTCMVKTVSDFDLIVILFNKKHCNLFVGKRRY